MKHFVLCSIAFFCVTMTSSFSLPFIQRSSIVRFSTTTSETDATTSYTVPVSWDEMVRQASACIKAAASDGNTRQIIRVLLPRDETSGDFGKYVETRDGGRALVPPDESWQGGIMQLYRAAVGTAQEIVQQVVATDSGVPPRVTEDRSVDESGVDGVGLLTTDNSAVTCWIQPTQELVDQYVQSAKSDDGVVVLMNPQWRVVDDALDTASKGEGLFAGLASFLGGKGGVMKQLSEAGYSAVYTLEGYVCRGANVRLLQTYGSDWQVFCERDDGETFIDVGKSPTRPSYQDVEELLNKADIGYKYARDIGLQPKL